MAGALLWGWDNTNKVWIPLQVDENGYVKVDISNIKLNDLANVSTGAPDDDDLFYYDNATSLWKSRKLVDADIPAAIARDTEVTSAIGDHAGLDTGIHGVGASKVCSEAKAILKALLTAQGDIITRNATAPKRLAKGTAGQVLTMGAAEPAWAAGAGGAKIQDADGDTSWDVEESADKDEVVGKVKAVEFFRGHDDGIITLAKQSGCHAYLSAEQSIPANSVWTKVNLNAEDFDIQGEFNTSTYKFTAKKAGRYLCIGRAAIHSVANGKYAQTCIRKNGNELIKSPTWRASITTENLVVDTGSTVELAVGDYLELYLIHSDTSAHNSFAGVQRVYLNITKVA